MNSTFIGLLLILTGLIYGSLAIDAVYNLTLGWLVNNGWIKLPEKPAGLEKNFFGRKPTILLYSFSLITLGFYIMLKLK
jgi:hypothetical protein